MFTYPKLYSDMVKKFPTDSYFVEVGSYQGQSSAYMAVEIANSNKKINFFCVDIWKKPGLIEEFTNNMSSVKKYYTPIKTYSHLAAKMFDDYSLDFVFLDADHNYKAVKKDLESWWPKIKQGGVLAGHDYNKDVFKAVNEFFSSGVEELREENCFKVLKY